MYKSNIYIQVAQRLGLVSKPSLPLSMEEWKSVESKTKERISPMQECPICIEPLGMHSQIILSCSHVFHKVYYYIYIYRNAWIVLSDMLKSKYVRYADSSNMIKKNMLKGQKCIYRSV